jgi:hypothetical protein
MKEIKSFFLYDWLFLRLANNPNFVWQYHYIKKKRSLSPEYVRINSVRFDSEIKNSIRNRFDSEIKNSIRNWFDSSGTNRIESIHSRIRFGFGLWFVRWLDCIICNLNVFSCCLPIIKFLWLLFCKVYFYDMSLSFICFK